MSLRSLLLAALLAAFLLATSPKWSDITLSVYLNVTNSTVKMCAVDQPTRCVFVPKLGNRTFPLTLDDVHHRAITIIYHERGWFYYYPPDFELLQHVAWVISNVQTYTVRVPAPGILYSPYPFYVNGRVATPQPEVCNMRIQYGYVVSAGTYTISGLWDRLSWLDPSTCVSYRLIDFISRVPNITGKAYLFIFYMPTSEKKYQVFRPSVGYWGQWMWGFNGTAHAYFVPRDFLRYVATGVYIANSTRLPVAVIAVGDWDPPFSYGPVHYTAYRNATNVATRFAMLTAGADPGDGIISVRFPRETLRGRVEVTYITNGSAGYVQLPSALPSNLWIYAQRYALAEVAVTNRTYVYAMRLFACPAYQGQSAMTEASVLYLPTRLDRMHEVEICNNNTRTLYVGVYVTSPFTGYSWLDVLEPGSCRRLRWDGIYSAVRYDFFNSTYNVCRRAAEFSVSGQSCPAGWRCHLFGRTLTPVRPIDIDAFYAAAWLNFTRYLAQLYNATINALLQWLNQQANASRSLADFLRSQPRFLGTIRMESSTSVWLRTTLNELQRWQVAAPPAAGGGISAGLLAPSALTASAAAAAVATAWAASRRSLATAAFLAGFAILAVALFTATLYGATVATSLILVGTLLMAIGAAAAWQKQTGEE